MPLSRNNNTEQRYLNKDPVKHKSFYDFYSYFEKFCFAFLYFNVQKVLFVDRASMHLKVRSVRIQYNLETLYSIQQCCITNPCNIFTSNLTRDLPYILLKKLLNQTLCLCFCCQGYYLGGYFTLPENCCINIFIFILYKNSIANKASFLTMRPYQRGFHVSKTFLSSSKRIFLCDSLKSRIMLQTPEH